MSIAAIVVAMCVGGSSEPSSSAGAKLSPTRTFGWRS